MPIRPYQAPRRQPNINDMMYPKGSRQPGNVWIGGIMMNVQKDSAPVTPTPTTTPTPSITPTMTVTPTPTTTPTPSITPTMTVTPTPTSSPFVYDSNAQTYLNSLVSNGATLDSTISAATNTFFVGLKNNSLFTKLVSMYPYIGSLSGSCKINAVQPGTYDISFNSNTNWTFNSSGSTANGTTGYGLISLTLNNGAVFPATTYGFGTYIVNLNTKNSGQIYTPIGVRGSSSSPSGVFQLYSQYSTNVAGGTLGNGDGGNLFSATTLGLLNIERIGTANSSLYVKGSLINTNTNAASARSSENISVGARRNRSLNNWDQYDNSTYGFQYISLGFTSGETSTLNTLIQSYMTSLGRNV